MKVATFKFDVVSGRPFPGDNFIKLACGMEGGGGAYVCFPHPTDDVLYAHILCQQLRLFADGIEAACEADCRCSPKATFWLGAEAGEP